jgi:hypothetical protein
MVAASTSRAAAGDRPVLPVNALERRVSRAGDEPLAGQQRLVFVLIGRDRRLPLE